MTNCHVSLPEGHLDPLSVALSYLSWNLLIAVTNDTQLPFPTSFCDRKFKHFVIGPDSARDINWILDSESDATKSSQLFLISCSLTCIEYILKKVNIHERHFDEQGVLTFHHHWLVLINRSDDFLYLERFVGNITHISFFVWQKESSEGLVYSAMWKPEGRRLELSARVVNGSVQGEIFPNLKFGLNGRRFIVAIKEWWPYVGKDTTKTGNEQFTGLSIEVFKDIAAYMNFTYTLIESTDDTWGDKVNGSWTGIVGEMAQKTADMTTGPGASRLREEVMDFSFPYYIDMEVYVYKHHAQPTLQSFLFIRPYKWQVWVCLCIGVPCISVMIYCYSHTSTSLNNKYKSFLKIIWSVFGLTFNNGVVEIEIKSPVSRIVFISWMFTCIVYSATYSSNLVALLTVSVERPPFDSLEALTTQSQFKFGLLGETYLAHMFKTSTGVHGRMWQRMTEWEQAGIPVLSSSHQTHVNLVNKGNYAYLTDGLRALVLQQASCDLRIFNNKMFRSLNGVGFQNNSAYVTPVSKVILRLVDAGVVTKLVKTYYPKQKDCQKGLSSTSPSSVKLERLSGVFYFMAGLLVLSTIILFMETIVHQYWKKRYS